MHPPKLFPTRSLAVSTILPSALMLIAAVQTALSYPLTPPVAICSDTVLLAGPATAPAGAITVAAGDNSGVNFSTANATFWFAPGVHTLGTGQYSQIQPGNNTTFIGGPGAILDGQSKNQYAFTGNARGVTIKYLTLRNFGAAYSNNNEGVVNHNSGTAWIIRYCTIKNVEGAAVFLGDSNEVCCNCLKDNGQYGFSMYKPEGVKHIRLDSNEICGNNTDDWETRQPGCGCTGGGKFWDVDGAVIRANYVHNNKSVGLWADTDDRNFLFEGNYIADNDAEGIFYEISYNFMIRDNTFVRNTLVKGKARGTDAFPDGAIYISSSSGDSTVSSTYAISEICGNHFVDNWNGVVLFEASDRFCGSVANTSSGYCPLNDLSNAKRRWYVRNVHLHDNVFEINKSAIGGTGSNLCGRIALLGDYGTVDPLYSGFACPTKTTFLQNNKFYGNTYIGDWHFQAYSTSTNNTYGWNDWRAAPPPASVCATAAASVGGADDLYGKMSYQKPPQYGFGQDSGSTFTVSVLDRYQPAGNSVQPPSLVISRDRTNSTIMIKMGVLYETEKARVLVTDIAGHLVADLGRGISNHQILWHAAGIRSGVYIVRASDGSRTLTQSIIL